MQTSRSIQKELICRIVAGALAWTAAEHLDKNCSMVVLYYHKLRQIIAARQKKSFGNITPMGYLG